MFTASSLFAEPCTLRFPYYLRQQSCYRH